MVRILLVLSAMFVAFFTPAWGADPVVIGAYLSMTGNVAAYGQMGWDGISIARKMEPQVLDRPVEVKLADTKSDKVESANAVPD